MGQALTLLLTGSQSFPPQARLIFSTGEQSAVGKSWHDVPNHPPLRTGQKSRSRSALGWLSCCPDPGSFPEAQATSIESFKYKTHVPNSLLEGGGVGEGGETTVRAPRTPELHVHRWSSLTQVDRVLPEAGACSGLTTQHPQPAWRPWLCRHPWRQQAACSTY